MDTRQHLKCNSCKRTYMAGCIYPPSKSKCKHCGHKGATKVDGEVKMKNGSYVSVVLDDDKVRGLSTSLLDFSNITTEGNK